jgi:hypothetical protein
MLLFGVIVPLILVYWSTPALRKDMRLAMATLIPPVYLGLSTCLVAALRLELRSGGRRL